MSTEKSNKSEGTVIDNDRLRKLAARFIEPGDSKTNVLATGVGFSPSTIPVHRARTPTVSPGRSRSNEAIRSEETTSTLSKKRKRRRKRKDRPINTALFEQNDRYAMIVYRGDYEYSNVANVAMELLNRNNSGGVFSLESTSKDSVQSKGSGKSQTQSPVLGHGPSKAQLNIQEFFRPLSQTSPTSNTLIVHKTKTSESVTKLETENREKSKRFKANYDKKCRKNISKKRSSTYSPSKQVDDLKKKISEMEEVRNQQLNMLEVKSTEIEGLKQELQKYKSRYNNLQRRVVFQVETIVREFDYQKQATIRKTSAEKSHSLGKIVVTKQGVGPRVKLGEAWEEGEAFKKLKERQAQLLQQKEELDKEKKLLAKLSRQRAKATNSSLDENEIEQLDALGMEEALKQQLIQLKKDEQSLAEEKNRLAIEKLIYIRDVKRLNNERTSRFVHRPVLNNRYLLRSLLGKGGFSEVWHAYDLIGLRDVALKVHELNSTWCDQKKAMYLKHATREYKIHMSLKHPRIVQLLDVFEIDTSSFATILEYCDGADLDFYLKKQKSLPEKEARAILLQILSGLRYLTSGGHLQNDQEEGNNDKNKDRKRPCIIHYDLKPGNILFDKSYGVKITDFGLSKIMEPTDSDTTGIDLTSQGTGTYWYLPPECFRMGQQPPKISTKVDVWSVGVIFYQMLYGRRPFGEGMSQDRILLNQTMLKATQVEFPEKPQISNEAKHFIQRCLTYNQEFRPDVRTICSDNYVQQRKS